MMKKWLWMGLCLSSVLHAKKYKEKLPYMDEDLDPKRITYEVVHIPGNHTGYELKIKFDDAVVARETHSHWINSEMARQSAENKRNLFELAKKQAIEGGKSLKISSSDTKGYYWVEATGDMFAQLQKQQYDLLKETIERLQNQVNDLSQICLKNSMSIKVNDVIDESKKTPLAHGGAEK